MSGTAKSCSPDTPRAPLSEAGPRTAPAMTWPLADRLELGALPSAVPCARLHTRAILAEWGLAHLNDTAELLISDSLNLSIYSFGPFWRVFVSGGWMGWRGLLWRRVCGRSG